jgi:ribosome-binding protein aMBF1 (putative translation factor)
MGWAKMKKANKRLAKRRLRQKQREEGSQREEG